VSGVGVNDADCEGREEEDGVEPLHVEKGGDGDGWPKEGVQTRFM